MLQIFILNIHLSTSLIWIDGRLSVPQEKFTFNVMPFSWFILAPPPIHSYNPHLRSHTSRTNLFPRNIQKQRTNSMHIFHRTKFVSNALQIH